MRDIQRKVLFFYLHLISENDDFDLKVEVNRLVNFIDTLSKADRKQNMALEKFCLIESSSYYDESCILKLLFKSAKHSYRAPLMDKQTAEERDNPKTMNEGERMKTHVVIKFHEGDAIVLLEKAGGTLSMENIKDYLHFAIQEYNRKYPQEQLPYRFAYELVGVDNFEEIINSMERVTCATVYVEKQMLGSEALNFSNRTSEVQQDIIIEIKAKRKESIIDTAMDFLQKKINGDQRITKIRAKGKTVTNNEIVVDTSFMGKKDFVRAQQDEDTGEVNSSYLFEQLIILANT